MKIIENRTTSIQDGEDKLTYKTLISICINKQEQGGYSIDEMRKRFRILDVIEKSDNIIELEDTDFDKAKELVNSMTWGVMNKDIIEFVDYINNLPKNDNGNNS